MSKSVFIGPENQKAVQWITDGEPCEPSWVPPCVSALVEVAGELNGEDVTFEGGLTLGDKMPFLVSTRITPFLATVPAIGHIRPITKAVGVTITVRGIK